jgi:hypothetical protein
MSNIETLFNQILYENSIETSAISLGNIDNNVPIGESEVISSNYEEIGETKATESFLKEII